MCAATRRFTSCFHEDERLTDVLKAPVSLRRGSRSCERLLPMFGSAQEPIAVRDNADATLNNRGGVIAEKDRRSSATCFAREPENGWADPTFICCQSHAVRVPKKSRSVLLC